MNRLLSLIVSRWGAPSDAGTDLRRFEAEGHIAVIGDNPATCLIEPLCPAVPAYDPAPRLPIDAWLAAWRVAQFPCRDRDLAIRQDLTRFRAGLLVLARLALCAEPSVQDAVVAQVRFDEAVAATHQWFLLIHHGVERGTIHYAALRGQVCREDVALEARLALVGIALRHPTCLDAADDGDSQEGWS